MLIAFLLHLFILLMFHVFLYTLVVLELELHSFSLSIKFTGFKFAYIQYVSQKILLLTIKPFVKVTIFVKNTEK